MRSRSLFRLLPLLLLALGGAREAAAQACLSTQGSNEYCKALTPAVRFGFPRYATAALPTCNTNNKGAVAYDTTTDTVKYCTGSAWSAVGSTFTGGTITSPILAPDGTASLPSYAWSANPSSGFYNVNTYTQYLSQGGAATYGFYDGSFRVLYNKSLGWATGADATGAPDLTLYRDAANTLALRNSTNAQTARIYSSYTDGSNYGRGVLTTDATHFTITTEGAGGGPFLSLGLASTSGYVTVNGALAPFSYATDSARLGAWDANLFWKELSLTRSIQGSKTKALTEGAATAVTQIAVPQIAGSNFADAVVQWTVYASDGTDTQTRRGSTYLAAVNAAGTETCTVGDIGTPVVAVSAGTLTCATSCITGLSDVVQFALDCTSSLTQTSLNALVRLDMDQPNTVTPQ